jgi:hypothetical protein
MHNPKPSVWIVPREQDDLDGLFVWIRLVDVQETTNKREGNAALERDTYVIALKFSIGVLSAFSENLV